MCQYDTNKLIDLEAISSALKMHQAVGDSPKLYQSSLSFPHMTIWKQQQSPSTQQHNKFLNSI